MNWLGHPDFNDVPKGSYYCNFFEILKNKDFEVERNVYKSLTLERADLKKIKEEMKENGEIYQKKQNKNINILRDDKSINKHINVRLLTIKTDL